VNKRVIPVNAWERRRIIPRGSVAQRKWASKTTGHGKVNVGAKKRGRGGVLGERGGV